LLEIGLKSVPGSEHPYEDRVLADEAKGLFAVADGVSISSQGSGGVAADLALKYLRESFSGRVAQALDATHRAILMKKQDDRTVGETTLTAASVKDGWLEIANVGDSPAYLARGSTMRSLIHEDRSPLGLITQVMGYSEAIRIHTTRIRLQHDDCVIIASDGVGHVLHPSLVLPLVSKSTANELAEEIINEAQVKKTGYDDDKSVVVLRYQSR
jgi:serine/threonine protein phosphatase PrpC